MGIPSVKNVNYVAKYMLAEAPSWCSGGSSNPVIGSNAPLGTGDELILSNDPDETIKNAERAAQGNDTGAIKKSLPEVKATANNPDGSATLTEAHAGINTSKENVEEINSEYVEIEHTETEVETKVDKQNGALNQGNQLKSEAQIAFESAESRLGLANKNLPKCESAESAAQTSYNSAVDSAKKAKEAYDNCTDEKAKPALLAAWDAAEALKNEMKAKYDLAIKEREAAEKEQAAAEKEWEIADKKLKDANADVEQLEKDLKKAEGDLETAKEAVQTAKENLANAQASLEAKLDAYEEHKDVVKEHAKDVYEALEKRLEELEKEEEAKEGKSTTSKNKSTWDKISQGASSFGQLAQLGQQFSQLNNQNANSSSKTSLTAYGSMMLDQTLADTSSFINRYQSSGGNLLAFDLAKSNSTTANNTNATTTSQSNSTNPFVLKKA